MAKDEGGFHRGHIFIATLAGITAGAWWANYANEARRRSRAERDAPELVEAVTTEVLELLEGIVARERLDREDEYRDDLAEVLSDNLERHVEVTPSVDGMSPDVLIEGVLALEVKRAPNKAERDRCVGQCAGYSRKWVTWIVLFETSASAVRALTELLADKGLDHILVICIEEQAFRG